MSRIVQGYLELRKLALRLPDTEEGIACAGTALEKRTIKTRGKAFLFLGVDDAMVKLCASLAAAVALARNEPDRYQAGKTGWVKVTFGEEPPPLALLEKWIAESHGLMAGTEPARARRSVPGRKVAKRPAKKKPGSP